MNKQQSRWIPMYRVEKRLTNANYIVRKINTNYTQCVHRMRLRPIKPQYEIQDLESIDPRNFEADPSIPEEEREPQFFDNQIEKHINQEAMTLPEQCQKPDQSVSIKMYKRRASQHKNRQQTINKYNRKLYTTKLHSLWNAQCRLKKEKHQKQ